MGVAASTATAAISADLRTIAAIAASTPDPAGCSCVVIYG